MNNINRRQFIAKTVLGLGSAALLSHVPSDIFGSLPAIKPKHQLGFQVYTIREMLVKDFAGTLKMMAGLGYTGVEMCSPSGYITSGFEPLVKMKSGDMRKIINDAGLICESSHFTYGELKDNLDDRIDFAKQLGMNQMICSSFWLPKNATMGDWMKACDQLNEIGMKTKKAGLQMGFHNHHMEFEKIDGVLIYDELMKQLDPDLVKMQFQVAVISIGYKASTYFEKYPTRFISAHLADWSTTDNKQVPCGQGVVDWKEFYQAAEKAGVKNFYVEMDMDKFKPSAEYLKGLK
jgi:sugar phosphate isomerase/epimerase